MYDYIITQWLSARLWYLQCIGTGDTTVLYYAISIITGLHTSFLPGLCQGYVICVNDRMEAVSKYTKTQVILSRCFSQYQWICYGFCVVIQFYCVVFIVCLWSNWFYTLHYSVEKKLRAGLARCATISKPMFIKISVIQKTKTKKIEKKLLRIIHDRCSSNAIHNDTNKVSHGIGCQQLFCMN